MTTGALLMAYGSPGSLDEVEPYLRDIRGGRPVSAESVDDLRERYRRIGGSSPLLEITRRQADALQRELEAHEPGEWAVAIGMKHWRPWIADAVRELVDRGVRQLVAVALAPHYSGMSIGGYAERVRRGLDDAGADMPVHVVRSWYDEPAFVDLVASNLRRALEGWDASDGTTGVVFTAHSLPERILREGDPYRDQLLESSAMVADKAGVPDWEFAFQSASHTGEPWLGPDVLERLNALAARGYRRVAVAPVGFVADHLEILFDVDVECAERAGAVGVELRRVASPNDDPRLVEALATVVRKAREEP